MSNEFSFNEGALDGVSTIGMVTMLQTVGFNARGPAKGVVQRLVTPVSSESGEARFVIVDMLGTPFVYYDSVVKLRIIIGLS